MPRPSPLKGRKLNRASRQKHAVLSEKSRENNPFGRLQESPEGQALLALWRGRADASQRGRSLGHLDGTTVRKSRRLRARASAEARRIVEHLAAKDMIPEGAYAREALEAAVSVVRLENVRSRDRVAAAKLVLDFTLAKPATETTLNVQTAEDFLDAVARDAGIGGSNDGPGRCQGARTHCRATARGPNPGEPAAYPSER
jgi:hypothetical protein